MTPGQTASSAVLPAPQSRLHRCGVAFGVDAAKLMRSGPCTARLHDRLTELARAGTPVALRVHHLHGPGSVHRFFGTCRGIREAFGQAGVDPRLLDVTVAAGSIPLRTAWLVRRTVLGDGWLNVSFDARSLHTLSRRRSAGAFWRDLWRLRTARLRSTFWPTVRSACTLLSPEHGTGVVPACGLQAPEQSAWLRAEFDLAKFADADGHVDLAALAASIAGVMDEADSIYDTTSWPTSKMQHDAWYNRRLAIVPVGIGDIASRRRLDPECHDSLAALRKLLASIRQIVTMHSRQRAMRHERLPSIAASNPRLHLPAGARQSAWQRHWHAALERHALRHRNLLVLSPWSLFPRDDADFRYANFLPLMAQADACEFRRSLSLHSWTMPELKLFHCRAGALNNAVLSSAIVADRP